MNEKIKKADDLFDTVGDKLWELAKKNTIVNDEGKTVSTIDDVYRDE